MLTQNTFTDFKCSDLFTLSLKHSSGSLVFCKFLIPHPKNAHSALISHLAHYATIGQLLSLCVRNVAIAITVLL